MNLRELENKKILILGFQKEGRDTLSFLRDRFPNKEIGIADHEKKEIGDKKRLELHFGKSCLEAVPKYDVIFKTPGIPVRKIKPFMQKGQELTSQDKFFLENCPGTIVGVTGTKGKGTTCSLIYNILKGTDKKVYLVGNIGEPRLAYLKKATPQDIFIQEFSARQLQLIKKSPHIAIFLNLYEAHLDFYEDFKEYKRAKEKITLFQKKSDYFIYNKDQKGIASIARRTRAQKIGFSLEKKADCFLKDEEVFWRQEKIIAIKQVPLHGRFNLENVMAAVCAGKLLKVRTQAIQKGVKEFRGLRHRLERVGEYKGIIFYNDSLATLPEPVMFALDTFADKVQTLILGGYEAGQKFEALAQKISDLNIKNIILFPPTGKRIKKLLKSEAGKIRVFETDDMMEAVKICFNNTDKDRICLLSPAAPSFGVFKNYKERGELFKKYVKEYAGKTAN